MVSTTKYKHFERRLCITFARNFDSVHNAQAAARTGYKTCLETRPARPGSRPARTRRKWLVRSAIANPQFMTRAAHARVVCCLDCKNTLAFPQHTTPAPLRFGFRHGLMFGPDVYDESLRLGRD